MKHFIICLTKIPSSLNTATSLKNKLEKYKYDVELFEGTYGNDAELQMNEEGRILHPFGIKGPIDPDNEKVKKLMTPGVKGCFLSHYRLWKKCVELNEPIFIWEDDIVIKRKFHRIEWNDVLIVALGHPQKSPKYIHYLDSPKGKPCAAPYNQSSMPGCCGYAIKPHAAKKLVDAYSHTYLPADNAINKHYVTMEIHSYVMGIAIVEGKKSLTKSNIWSDPDKLSHM